MFELVESAKAHRRARRVMPAGNTRLSAYEGPHPIYLASGKGAYVTDVDGNRYLDCQNNFTALIHGHGHPEVQRALERQVRLGLCFANPTLLEIELAELLCDRVPHFEHVRFTNTGSEAVMMAIKAARALTGRQRIALCDGAYHGNYDFVEVTSDRSAAAACATPAHHGVSCAVLDDVLLVPFNDLPVAKNVLEANGERLAAVLFDPMPSRAGLVPVSAPFLSMLRQVTERSGALLIADEVLNFRRAYDGALSAYQVRPDITAFGKIIGGGLPIGAIAGSSEVMRVFDPSRGKPLVAHAGTFTANPLSMTAGIAAMRAMTAEAFDRLNGLGEEARVLLQQVVAEVAAPLRVVGAGSLMRIVADAQPASGDAAKDPIAPLAIEMRRRGVLVSSIGLIALSTPMEPRHVKMLADVLREAWTHLHRAVAA